MISLGGVMIRRRGGAGWVIIIKWSLDNDKHYHVIAIVPMFYTGCSNIKHDAFTILEFSFENYSID